MTSAALLALLLLAGCGAAEDAVRGAADEAGREARDAAGEVAGDAVRDRVCGVVGDGEVSAAELGVLRTVVAGAEGAGLPEDLTAAARDVVGSGDDPSSDAVRRLEEACSAGSTRSLGR